MDAIPPEQRREDETSGGKEDPQQQSAFPPSGGSTEGWMFILDEYIPQGAHDYSIIDDGGFYYPQQPCPAVGGPEFVPTDDHTDAELAGIFETDEPEAAGSGVEFNSPSGGNYRITFQPESGWMITSEDET